MNGLVWSRFQSYIEIGLCTRLSATMWADSVIVSWESLTHFFKYFGLTQWDPANMLKRQQFDKAEAFIFYNFFSECLAMDADDNVTLTFNLERLNDVRHKYEMIFLYLQKFEWTQRTCNVNYYYPDILLNTAFEPTKFDALDYPFIQDPSEVVARILNIDPTLLNKMEIGVLTTLSKSSKLDICKDFKEGTKPEVLVDEGTVQYLQDPNSLFNLTLSKFPQSQTIFLGQLSLKPAQSDYIQPLTETKSTKINKAIQLPAHTPSTM